ncbi:MAG TPA: hypothetical protein VKA08_12875 [Balneolales bacterium]|nr:hypothetical protein [Balneolales bacterium]
MEINEELISAKPNVKKVKKDAIYRHAYIYIAGIFLFIFVGFFPDYFSRLGKTDLIHHIHAVFAMLWMVLVVTQTYLIGRDNVQWHRRLGKLSFVLAPMLVITALDMVHLALGRGTTPLTLGDGRIALAYIDISLLLYFILFYILAIVNRRDFRKHQRFMVSTAFVVIPPALGRIPFFYMYPGHLSAWMSEFYAVIFIEIVLLILLYNDWRKNKLYFAYGFSFLFFLFVLVTAHMSLSWHWWLHFSRWLAG